MAAPSCANGSFIPPSPPGARNEVTATNLESLRGPEWSRAWQLAGQWCQSAAWLWVAGEVEEAAEALEAVEGLLLAIAVEVVP